MAKILTFRTGEMRRDDSGGAASQCATAEVIVFPGVRYEHWDEARETQAQLQPAAKKCEQQRDVLELAE